MDCGTIICIMERPGTVGFGVNMKIERLDGVGLAVSGLFPERIGSKQMPYR